MFASGNPEKKPLELMITFFRFTHFGKGSAKSSATSFARVLPELFFFVFASNYSPRLLRDWRNKFPQSCLVYNSSMKKGKKAIEYRQSLPTQHLDPEGMMKGRQDQ